MAFNVILQETIPWILPCTDIITHTHTHTCLTALFPGLPRWAGTRKVKPIWILLKQETVCKFAPRSRQITTPAPHHSFFTGWMPRDQPNSRFHGRDNFCEIGLLPWKTLISKKSMIFVNFNAFTFIYEGFKFYQQHLCGFCCLLCVTL